jgi:hypothetical protein
MSSHSRTFRISVSSTFSDLKAERDALQSEIFPKLKDSVSNMVSAFRPSIYDGGIGEEASLDQQTVKTCLEELPHCQKVQGWYRRDEHALPPVYLLQPRTGKFIAKRFLYLKIMVRSRRCAEITRFLTCSPAFRVIFKGRRGEDITDNSGKVSGEIFSS